MIRKSIGLLASMLVTVAVYAAGVQLQTNHPDDYVVRRGDTLWGIASHFLAKPWLWPEIWQANPQVQNPHLIYPGDVLNLSFINGFGPALQLQPSVHREADAVPAIPLSELQMFLKEMRVMDADQVKAAPYVVGFEEAQLRGTSGQNIYVRGLQATPGQRWVIVRPTHVMRGFDADDPQDDERQIVAHDVDSDVSMVKGPWDEKFRDDGHFSHGQYLGVEVRVIGSAETLRTGDVSTLLLLDSTEEIRKGDRIMPANDHPYDPYFYPHAPKGPLPNNPQVIAFTDALDAVGSRQVVALSVGSKDGIDNGTTFDVWQKGERISDDVASNSWDRAVGKKVTLPEEFVGHVMVFRTFDQVSYALVMDSLKPVHRGNDLRMPQ